MEMYTTTHFFLNQNCPFQSITVRWYVCKKKSTFYILSVKGVEGGGGQSLADISANKWIFFYALLEARGFFFSINTFSVFY